MTRTARGHRTPAPGADQRARADERANSPDEGGQSRQAQVASAWQSMMHDRSVRSRVALLVLLPLLGALIFGALLFREVLERAQTASDIERNAEVAAAALAVAGRLQDERDVSGLFDIGATGQGAVADARNATDEAIGDLREHLNGLPDDADPAVVKARDGAMRNLAFLDAYRGSRDVVLEPYDPEGVNDYNRMVRFLLPFVKASGTQSTNTELVGEIDALESLARATEIGSIERGLLAHVLASSDPLSDAEREREAILRGEQDNLLERFASVAEPTFRAEYYNQLPDVRGAVEEIRIAALAAGEAPGVTPEAWYEAATERLGVLRSLQDDLAADIVEKSSDAANRAQIIAIVTAVLMLAILVATIALTVAVARSITGPLRRLRRSALETADIELPALVSRIHSDGPAVVRNVGDAVTPEGSDEIGQVANAFNDVYSTAIRVAGEQALLRQNLDTIVVNLSRRTQTLVDRQLGEIDNLEERERDPDQLGTLFRIDHLATRVRRHAESLLVLAGVEEMRRVRTAAPVLEVVRTAVSEVEQYPRVKFGVMPTDLVIPTAVDDVAHLLAELLDNATEFSAPSTQVTITSQPLLGGGLRIQVADSGVGIPPEELQDLNERLRQPSDIDVAASKTLGLYVVARLAARHGILVRLVPGEPSGTVAQVDLPAQVVVSPLETGEGVAPAVPEQPRAASLLDGEAAGETPAPTVGPLRPPGQPSQPVPTPMPVARPLQPVNGQVGTNGGPSRTGTRPAEVPARPEKRSLRAPQPKLPESDSPIFEAVKSAWFQSGGGDIEWSTPADEGWRRAAAALRTAEEAATARRAQAPNDAAAPVFSHTPPPAPEEAGVPEVAEELAFSTAGLPVRRRGGTQIPGSIAEITGEMPGVSHEVTQQDAGKVASTLSNLQRGVNRGREATGGWVPERPDDPEGSNP
jgi:signal transduction histidine kinase